MSMKRNPRVLNRDKISTSDEMVDFELSALVDTVEGLKTIQELNFVRFSKSELRKLKSAEKIAKEAKSKLFKAAR